MPELWVRLLCVSSAGAAGALSRYGCGLLAERLGSGPAGLWAVNLVGSLLFGLVAGLPDRVLPAPPVVRLLLLTGFLGAFTTFSTFSYETLALWRQQRPLAAAGLAFGQPLAGVCCAALGLWLSGGLGRPAA